MFMQPLISIGVTATTYVSQNLGAGKLERNPQRAALLHGDQLCVVDVLHPHFLLGN